MKFFYARVSSVSQNLARQLEQAKSLGIDEKNVYTDKLSGKDTNRPSLQELLSYLREGDVLYISSFDRLARSTKDLLSLAEELESKGVALVSLKENLDCTTPQGKLMFTMFAAFAEFERAIIKERQAEGIAIAKRDGRMTGRPKTKKEKLDIACTMYQSGEYKMKEIEAATGISYGTIYREVNKRGIKRN
jgi:DNA invertase Pin-like site-specific DNA recombinase